MILTVSGLKPGGIAGIDLGFFNCTANFCGIKNIPEGPHIFHYGESLESLRHAVLFKKSSHLEFKDSEFLWGDAREPNPQFMLEYPVVPDWQILASDIDFEPSILNTLTALPEFKTAKQTWPDGVVGSERTEYYLDKSWYVMQQGAHKLTGQFQLAFILFIICRNPQAEMNWHVLVELLFSCKRGLEEKDWGLYLVKILRAQLKIMPEDYRHEEIQFLERALQNLYINVNGLGTRELQLDPEVEIQAQHVLNTLQNWGADWSSDHVDEQFTAPPW